MEDRGKKLSHSKFGQEIAKILKSKGCWLFNVHGERMQKRGVPDLLVIGLRWKGFLEFKIGVDKCKDIQKEQIERLVKRNFPCYVLRHNRELDCIAIEDRNGVMLNLVAWGALWDWLKKPIIVSESSFHNPVQGDSVPTLYPKRKTESLRREDKVDRRSSWDAE